MVAMFRGSNTIGQKNHSAKKGSFSLSSVIYCVIIGLGSLYIAILCTIANNSKDILPTELNRFKLDNDSDTAKTISNPSKTIDSASKGNVDRTLTAYLEPIDESQWAVKPLPRRTSTATDLMTKTFSTVNSCSNLLEQLPVDQYPDEDPFLPWIHDVFPSHDGKFIQIVAQNRRRCATGKRQEDIYRKRAPQVALFQNVAVKRVNNIDSDSGTRYRLASHEEADEDGVATRFICRFSNGEETLSVFNFSYEWKSYQKRLPEMFHENKSNNQQVHTSQLLFRCPVPESLVESVRTGESVVDDYATIFFDLVPIRTPPRYGPPNTFLPPYYEEFLHADPFNAIKEWGTDHILPKIEDSGRWQNIPVCKPSLLTYGKQSEDTALITPADSEETDETPAPIKQHRLISCLWASAGYATRGERFAINDGQRRLLEWVMYNKLTGVEHFYLYDNSEAHSADVTLKFIADIFPDDVTVINWPSKVCNNNSLNDNNPGERSSQYAAEASCRLRFGPHTEWIAQFDIDEYLVPMGDLTSLHPLLDKLDDEGTNIFSSRSYRAWPRRKFIEDPNLTRMSGVENCGSQHDCFQVTIPQNYTMLQAYNCDRQKPGEKKDSAPAEKEIYRPDYVLHHFVHYSTVTALSNLNREDYEKIEGSKKWRKNPFPDPHHRFGDENEEALMLHTKAVAHQDTGNWDNACLADYNGMFGCRLGNPFPDDLTGVNVTEGSNGLKYNCYVNHKIDDYWVKNLEDKLKEHVPELAKRIEAESLSTV